MTHPDTGQAGGQWRVDITIDACADRDRAVAPMAYRDRTLIGVGRTKLTARDAAVGYVGEQLAVARALSDLTRQLFVAAACDVDAVIGENTEATEGPMTSNRGPMPLFGTSSRS